MSDFGTSPVAAPAAPQPAADTASLEDRLQQAGLRVTRQRMALGRLLFNGQHQHINAEELHRRAIAAKANLTLATVYNTLHQFRAAGLLREVAVSASSIYFDTDTSDHHHFFIENDGAVIDMPPASVSLDTIPEPPEGMEVTHVDVIVRVRRIGSGRRAG